MRTIAQVQNELKAAQRERFVAYQKLNVTGLSYHELRCTRLEAELRELSQSRTVHNRLAPYFVGLGNLKPKPFG